MSPNSLNPVPLPLFSWQTNPYNRSFFCSLLILWAGHTHQCHRHSALPCPQKHSLIRVRFRLAWSIQMQVCVGQICTQRQHARASVAWHGPIWHLHRCYRHHVLCNGYCWNLAHNWVGMVWRRKHQGAGEFQEGGCECGWPHM